MHTHLKLSSATTLPHAAQSKLSELLSRRFSGGGSTTLWGNYWLWGL